MLGMRSFRPTSHTRPQVGIDVRPRLLAGALDRVLSQQGWTVIDVSERTDQCVDILVVTEHAVIQPTRGDDTLVIVLPGPDDDGGVALYRGGTQTNYPNTGDHLEQLLALLSSDSL